MNWYKEYQAEWKEIIETVAKELLQNQMCLYIRNK